jgi:hypothetical protein
MWSLGRTPARLTRRPWKELKNSVEGQENRDDRILDRLAENDI